MKAHGMLLSPPMARARAEKLKTQTRRAIGAYNSLVDGRGVSAKNWAKYDFDFTQAWHDNGPSPAGNPGPYLHVPSRAYHTTHRIYPTVFPGDEIWWKETYRIKAHGFTNSNTYLRLEYRADGGQKRVYTKHDKTCEEILFTKAEPGPWKSSLLMPRKFSRTTDRVTRVRIERIQEITNEDALAEGVLCATEVPYIGGMTSEQARHAYALLFDHINGKGAWDRNDWVYVYEWKL